ncbi:MAG: sensor histidine kinase, partial [Nitrospirota bacterium]|nr:sensor histidine kinase [Nitrospirota bacterium]
MTNLGAWLRDVLIGEGERRARLRTLTVIRWIAIVGQAFTILLVHFPFGFPLPLPSLLAAVGLSAFINLWLSIGFGATTRLTERTAALLLGYDILQLTFLLALTGGLQNPFSILLMVPVTLSATIFSLRTTAVLSAVVIAAATALGLVPTALPWGGDGLTLPGLYIAALWTALALGTALIAGYTWRVADEARRMSDAVAATQMALARE